MVGEIKRHFRDKGWAVRVPRGLQELNVQLSKIVEDQTVQLGRSPTIAELAGIAPGRFVDGSSLVPLLSSNAPVASSIAAPTSVTIVWLKETWSYTDANGVEVFHEEIGAFMVLMSVAGNDTTKQTTSWAMLALDRLSKTYADGTRALSDVTLAVQPGDRWSSMAKLLEALEEVRSSGPGLRGGDGEKGKKGEGQG